MRRFLPVTGDAAAMAFPSPSPDAVPVLDVVEPQAPAYEPIAAATGAANSALFLDPVGPAASARPSASAFSGPASWTATGFVVPPLSHPPGPTSCSVCADRRTLGVAPGTAPFAASGSAFPFGKPPCSGSGRVSGATGRVSESSACAAPPASATVLTLSGHRLLCTADCSCRDTSELDELKAKVADFELAFRRGSAEIPRPPTARPRIDVVDPEITVDEPESRVPPVEVPQLTGESAPPRTSNLSRLTGRTVHVSLTRPGCNVGCLRAICTPLPPSVTQKLLRPILAQCLWAETCRSCQVFSLEWQSIPLFNSVLTGMSCPFLEGSLLNFFIIPWIGQGGLDVRVSLNSRRLNT